jgi:molybdate transport system substrate-binding protein
MRHIIKMSILLGLVFTASLVKTNGQNLRIAVAANAQFVTDSLKKAFQKGHPGKIELIVSSSGKLTAQIEHGAPFDIFMSADMQYAKTIFNAGNALTKPKVYAAGKLVLWTTKDLPVTGLDALKNPAIKSIAVASPKTAPYGVAAITALKKAGIYASIKNKIVFGESISQVNQYQLSGATDVAFTALSIVQSPELRHKGKWTEISSNLYEPIDQGVIILKHAGNTNSDQLKQAKDFYQFLFSAQGKAIFTYFGYNVK